MSDDLDLAAIRNMAGRIKDRHCEPGGDRSAYLLAIHAGKLLDRIAELEAHPPMLIDPAAEQRGYDKAVANLLDTDRFVAWAFRVKLDAGIISDACARYLEAVRDQP